MAVNDAKRHDERLEEESGSEFSEDSFDVADFEELSPNDVNWSKIVEANDRGQTRKLFEKENKGKLRLRKVSS